MGELEPLAVESPEIREKRHEIADVFFYQYIKGADSKDAIEAIQELISYTGDLDKIAQMMALYM